jgi:DegV family protein with EDD domain
VTSLPQVAVVTDSTADFATASTVDLNLKVVPLTVNWGKDILRDGVDIGARELYGRLRGDTTVPHTAAPPIGIFEDLYEDLLDMYDEVVSIHLSSRLSGTYDVAGTAARTVDPRRIHVVDSMSTSVGLGWLAERAATLAAEGATPATILAATQAMMPHIRLYLTLDTLEYLRRGGRIGRAQAFLGGLLNVKPILSLRDGEVLPVERVRTRASSTRRLAELAGDVSSAAAVAIVHGDCPDEAATLRTVLEGGNGAIPIVETGAILATHTGPGLLGVGWIVGS